MSYVPPTAHYGEASESRPCGTENDMPGIGSAVQLGTRTSTTSAQYDGNANEGGNPDNPSKMTRIGIKFKEWLKESAWPGMGLFGESYLLFSVGTLKPIWTILYPDCFAGSSYVVEDGNDYDGGHDEYGDGVPVCSDGLLHSVTYSVVLGVILGMSALGTFANRIGRRAGSILTASLMAFGALGMALISLILEDAPATLFGCMAGLLFVFGIGELRKKCFYVYVVLIGSDA